MPFASPAMSRGKLVFWIVLVLAAHVAALAIFSSKRPIIPRAATRVPHLRLLDEANELVALNDPTLFALPHANDFARAFWQRIPTHTPPRFHRPEPAGELLVPVAGELGAALRQFVQTNRLAAAPLNFKLPPQLRPVTVSLENDLPQRSTMQITGELANRPQLNRLELPSIALDDVLPAGTVQVLVDKAGNVTSVVLLESSAVESNQGEVADRLALQLAGELRFAPADRPTLGKITFHWHTVPTTTP